MLASQLIYTGCGKNKTGDYSVWAKSFDITNDEAEEISKFMDYSRMSHLPYVPTQEQIDTKFPKKLGYFYLSTGKVCLAQSVYIGNMYSDSDTRIGNFFIHALIFDNAEDMLPMNFIDSDLFKRCLTYEEWHDHDAPDELPKVEIVNPDALTKQELDEFFDDNRIAQFKLLLQSIITSMDTDLKVTFYDDHGNLKYWYRAISACIPTFMQQKLTFCSFGISAVSSDANVKIRSIVPINGKHSVYDYQQEAGSGKYSFDFKEGILPKNIKAGAYVNRIVDCLRTNISNAFDLADSVGKIKNECNVDFDTALDIHYLLNKQIAEVDDIEKLNSLIRFAKDNYQDKLTEIADGLYEYGLRSGKWELSNSIFEIYRFVFDYSEAADKGDMICQFIKSQRSFGVDENAKGDEYYSSFKKCAPFAWTDFGDFIFDDDNRKKYFEANGLSFNSRMLIFNEFVELLPGISDSKEQRQIALRYFVDTARCCIQNEQLEELRGLIKCIEKCGSKWPTWIVEKTYSIMCGDGKRLSDVCNPGFTLSLAEICSDKALASRLVAQLSEENENSDDFIKIFVERYDRNSAFYSAVLDKLADDPKYATFIRNVERYRFAVSKIVTKMQLQNYYDEYFVADNDDEGLFVTKLKQYLSTYSGQECINESLSCYDLWIKEKNLAPDALNPCAGAICDAFFSVPGDILKEYIGAGGTQKIEKLLASVPDTYRASNDYYVIALGENIKSLAQKISAEKESPCIPDVLEKLANEEFYNILPEDGRFKEMFVRLYLADVFHLYLVLATNENFENVYNQIFKPLDSIEGFYRHFYDELNNLNEKEHDLFLIYTVICAFGDSGEFNKCLMQLVENKLDNTGRGKRKRFFAQLLAKVPEQYEKSITNFVHEYQKAHGGLFGKFIGTFESKNVKDAPKDNRKRKQ